MVCSLDTDPAATFAALDLEQRSCRTAAGQLCLFPGASFISCRAGKLGFVSQLVKSQHLSARDSQMRRTKSTSITGRP